MNVGIILQQTLLAGMIEVCPVIDAGLFAWCTTEHLRPPCVEMRIEVDYSNWTVSAVHTAEKWQGDRMVAAECNDTWKSFAFLRNAWLFCIRGWISHEDGVVALFDLVESPSVIVACDR